MRKKLYIINKLYKNLERQHGAVLLVMLVILIMGGTAMLLNSLNSVTPKLARDRITADALAQAKEALIGYATAVEFTGSNRPGDLPCPDINNDGVKDSPCGNAAGTTGQTLRLGRLPWKTLGLPDLRDGSGERLWYAVSSNFKEHWNTLTPLNSDTAGTISVRALNGSLVNDGSSSSGAVAIIIAPGHILQRTDKTSRQDRSTSGENNPENYLELASGEDNARFIDATGDGFIQGIVKDANDTVILNDQILIIAQESIMQPIRKRVAKEVASELKKYYCGDTNVNPAGGCLAAGGNRFYPRPANFSNTTCLGNGNLSGNCVSDISTNNGRIPATPATAWSASSVLRGTGTGNWFGDNAWREVIFYAVANACSDGTTDCNGTGYLTLSNTPGNQKVIVIATGRALTGQSHSAPNTLSNYLEGGNLTILDDNYTTSDTPPFNDIVISIP